MTEAESTAKFECHNLNIDIQVCIHGVETIGWKPREKCVTPKAEYNPEKDVQFYNDAPDMFFSINGWTIRHFLPRRCPRTHDW